MTLTRHGLTPSEHAGPSGPGIVHEAQDTIRVALIDEVGDRRRIYSSAGKEMRVHPGVVFGQERLEDIACLLYTSPSPRD